MINEDMRYIGGMAPLKPKRLLRLKIIVGAILIFSIIYIIAFLGCIGIVISDGWPESRYSGWFALVLITLLLYVIVGIISSIGLLQLKPAYLTSAEFNEVMVMIFGIIGILIYPKLSVLPEVGIFIFILVVLPHFFVLGGLSIGREKLETSMLEAKAEIERRKREVSLTTPIMYPPYMPPAPQPTKEIYVKEIHREIVRIKCSHCGVLADQTEKKCPNCGAPF